MKKRVLGDEIVQKPLQLFSAAIKNLAQNNQIDSDIFDGVLTSSFFGGGVIHDGFEKTYLCWVDSCKNWHDWSF